MGKNLRQQRRGKGSSRFRAPSFNYRGEVKYRSLSREDIFQTARIKNLVHCPGHSAPLAEITYDNGEKSLMIAPDGVKVGDLMQTGSQASISAGNTLPLQSIPEGTLIFNVESRPGDGGKFARTSGSAAKILSKTSDKVIIMLPSKKQREFNPACRASIGIVAGAGRTEKPLVKAGNNYFKRSARNQFYPHVCALSMNAVAHPFGGSRSSKKGKSTIAPRNAPPGRKVGLIRPRRSGRRR